MESQLTATKTREREATEADGRSSDETPGPATGMTLPVAPHRYPAGWYADPSNPALSRWWDGQSWGDQTYAHHWGGKNPR
jgi:hypothetical protein